MSSIESPSEAFSRAPLVFLSADLGTDIGPVSAMLDNGGFQSVQWTQLPAGGFAHSLVSTLSRCSALVAVVDRPLVGSAVILEIGAALGRDVPVVVLAMNADAATGIEPVLQELPAIVVKGDLAAVGTRLAETIRALIDARTADPGTGLRAAPTVQGGAASNSGVAFEIRVATILAELGARVLPELPSQAADGRHDLAIWVDGLPHPSLNPILIEVKLKLRSRRGHNGVSQLRAALAAHKCVLGLIVIDGEQVPDWSITAGAAIATIGADTLAHTNLARLLNEGRNLWVHQPA